MKFPYYLAAPEPAQQQWFAAQLVEARGGRTQKNIADKLETEDFKNPAAVIAEVEKGRLHLPLGILREIVQKGYGLHLNELLKKFYDDDTHKTSRRKPFVRENHYSASYKTDHDSALPYFVGGDPSSFLWAVPNCLLDNQPLSFEYLEIAPKRKRHEKGEIRLHSHSGVEIIQVIHGTIKVTFEGPGGPSEELKPGECVHFQSLESHSIENCELNTCALMSVVRMT